MDSLEQLYDDFLSEMNSLEHFRRRFLERHPSAPLEREDPDVRRLIESMAFFSVQTRQATLRSLRSVWWRLFAGFFDFMVEPVPSAALVQAMPTEKMVEPVVLPRGTELRLTPQGEAPGFFRTRRELRVLPAFLERTDVLPLPRGGHRLILRFESRFARKDEVGLLSLHVRHLDNYSSSLAVFHALCRHLRQASVVYNESAASNPWGPLRGVLRALRGQRGGLERLRPALPAHPLLLPLPRATALRPRPRSPQPQAVDALLHLL